MKMYIYKSALVFLVFNWNYSHTFFFFLMYNSVRDAWVDQQFVKTLK